MFSRVRWIRKLFNLRHFPFKTRFYHVHKGTDYLTKKSKIFVLRNEFKSATKYKQKNIFFVCDTFI